MKTIPEKWVVVSISKEGEETVYKVFGSWSGGYARGDSWRLNSGISSVYLESENYRFSGFSGSHYVCNRKSYGFANNYAQSVLNNITEDAKKAGYTIEVLPKDYDFLRLLIKNK